MNIKRYEPVFGNGAPDAYNGEMIESPNGEYHSRADLIAAGCLVPVPDGEAMGVWDAGFLRYFQCDHPGVWRLQGCSMNHMAPCQIKNISDGTVTELINNTIVQPVRLVRLEDVG